MNQWQVEGDDVTAYGHHFAKHKAGRLIEEYKLEDDVQPIGELNAEDDVKIITEINVNKGDQPVAKLNVEDLDQLLADLSTEDVVRPIAELNADNKSVFSHNTRTFLKKYNHPDVAYAVGDIVMDGCLPFIVHIMQPFKSRVCNFCCLFKDNLTECECKIVFHCDEVCKLRDLKRGHEIECRSRCFRVYCQEGGKRERRQFVFKLYSMLAKELNFWMKEVNLNDGSTHPLHQVILRPDGLRPTEHRLRMAREMTEQINASHPEYGIMEKDIIFYDSVISAYGIPMFDERYKAVFALGLYFEPSSLSHSCTPNTRFFIEGLKLHLRAIGPIQKDEQPTIGFMNCFKNFEQRTSYLKRNYNLACSCRLCKFEILGVEKVNYDLVGKLVRYLDKLRRQPNITQEWKKIYDFHRAIVISFRHIYVEYDARITMQLCKTFHILSRMTEAPQPLLRAICKESLDHLRHTYGEKHVYYVEFEDGAKKSYASLFPESQNTR